MMNALFTARSIALTVIGMKGVRWRLRLACARSMWALYRKYRMLGPVAPIVSGSAWMAAVATAYYMERQLRRGLR